MASHPELKYSHYTFVFYPLKNPEIEERQPLLADANHESSQYLRSRPGGFIFLRWLQNIQGDPERPLVALFASVDRPHELVVVKKLRAMARLHLAADDQNGMAAEIEHCTLSTADPMVQRQLPLYHPNMESTPFPQMFAFQVHNIGEKRWDESGTYQLASFRDGADVTLVQKYYNGGTLGDLLSQYVKKRERVPEGFIWHFLSQIGRALSWLHTGRIPEQDSLTPDSKADKEPDWKAICHHDLHAGNIFLHYPTDEEKAADPRLKQFTDWMPQIIIGDFGLSFQAHNDRTGEQLCNNDYWHLGMPEPETLLDKGDLGYILISLMTAHLDPDSALEAGRTKAPRGFSKELEECWDKFWPLAVLVRSQIFFDRLRETRAQDWAHFPSNDYVYARMLFEADLSLSLLRHEDNPDLSVRWTQPTQTAPCMPWQSKARGYQRRHRQDWRPVMHDLEAHKDLWFRAFRNDCVEIRQVHFIGAGTPEKELAKVDKFGPPIGTPRVTKQPAPEKATNDDPEDLKDFSDFENENDNAAAAPTQAKRAAVQPEGHRMRPVRPESVYRIWTTQQRIEASEQHAERLRRAQDPTREVPFESVYKIWTTQQRMEASRRPYREH